MSIPDDVKDRVRRDAGDRCGYCLSHQRYVFAPLEIDRILPSSRGGSDDEGNLWLACRICNNYKGSLIDAKDPITDARVPLFNPRVIRWDEHFRWSADGSMVTGVTPIGRATTLALQLNNVIAVMVRREWISAGWHPPL